ncbi:hypothetical protein KIN20_020187 [Parelaphostrongylus tenuis]|uniref:Uncharacterized protein n=1 Tax=Parelaphostrongylus tenuis TaxID=148309 RepID=A0AAD5N9J2_PARTN|nr:hypothetical protein KIN20_020187 [Parelaphostrongylus tenuis]
MQVATQLIDSESLTSFETLFSKLECLLDVKKRCLVKAFTLREKEYGSRWYLDQHSSQFKWWTSHWNVKPNGRWSKKELKEVVRVL